MKNWLIAALVLSSCALQAQRKQSSRSMRCPANHEILTHFGERADFFS